MELFPYEFRPKQAELVRFIDSAVRDGRPAVIEAGTGIGKTVSALCGTLPLVLEKGTKVLYLTRTKSQQKQVVRTPERTESASMWGPSAAGQSSGR